MGDRADQEKVIENDAYVLDRQQQAKPQKDSPAFCFYDINKKQGHRYVNKDMIL